MDTNSQGREILFDASVPNIILLGTYNCVLWIEEFVASIMGSRPFPRVRYNGRGIGMIIPSQEITIRCAEVNGGAQVKVIAADSTLAMLEGRATFRKKLPILFRFFRSY